MSVTTQELIDDLTELRSERWRLGLPAGELSQQLDDAYDRLRRERAAAINGSAVEIAKRARVERELEKLHKVDNAT